MSADACDDSLLRIEQEFVGCLSDVLATPQSVMDAGLAFVAELFRHSQWNRAQEVIDQVLLDARFMAAAASNELWVFELMMTRVLALGVLRDGEGATAAMGELRALAQGRAEPLRRRIAAGIDIWAGRFGHDVEESIARLISAQNSIATLEPLPPQSGHTFWLGDSDLNAQVRVELALKQLAGRMLDQGIATLLECADLLPGASLMVQLSVREAVFSVLEAIRNTNRLSAEIALGRVVVDLFAGFDDLRSRRVRSKTLMILQFGVGSDEDASDEADAMLASVYRDYAHDTDFRVASEGMYARFIMGQFALTRRDVAQARAAVEELQRFGTQWGAQEVVAIARSSMLAAGLSYVEAGPAVASERFAEVGRSFETSGSANVQYVVAQSLSYEVLCRLEAREWKRAEEVAAKMVAWIGRFSGSTLVSFAENVVACFVLFDVGGVRVTRRLALKLLEREPHLQNAGGQAMVESARELLQRTPPTWLQQFAARRRLGAVSEIAL